MNLSETSNIDIFTNFVLQLLYINLLQKKCNTHFVYTKNVIIFA